MEVIGMKKVLSILLAAIMLLSTCAFSLAEEADAGVKMGLGAYIESVESVEKITLPLYVNSPENPMDIELLILNGLQDIPYVSLNDIVSLLDDLIKAESQDYSMTLTVEESGTVFVTRDNGAVLMVDTDAHMLSFSDADLFARTPGAANGLDVNHNMPDDPDYEVTLYRSTGILYREKKALEYHLDDYDIYMHVQDGKVYLPLQTISDILLSNALNTYALYNRQCVILTNGIPGREEIDAEPYVASMIDDSMTEEQIAEIRANAEEEFSCYTGPYYDLSRLYFAGETQARSIELAVFSYNELCMAMDHNYGLREEHRIDSFDAFFKETGFASAVLTEDAYEHYAALRDLICAYLADGHSGSGNFSWLAEFNLDNSNEFNRARFEMSGGRTEAVYTQTRAEYYDLFDSVPGYEEVGNTAIITFDSFTVSGHSEYYTAEITDDASDTIALMIYANRRINREDSPIERVVIDLTMNEGGSASSAACMVSWILGYSDFRLENTVTGTQGIIRHEFDVNLDHVIDEQDCLLTANPNIKGVYCLIGPLSFSCANLVPAMLKGEPNVTIIGSTSGGGACSVMNLSTAEGNIFTISSPIRINTVKNGTFYSVDEGVNPDIYISDIHHLYDRAYLVNMINNLD